MRRRCRQDTTGCVSFSDRLTRVILFAIILALSTGGMISSASAVATNRYSDVDSSYPQYWYIEWMGAEGIATGWQSDDGSAEFRPQDAVERGAMAAFLFRLAASLDPTISSYVAPEVSPFTDVSTDYPQYREIAWMFTTGIATGWVLDNGLVEFRPQQDLERGALAAFLYRLGRSMGLIEEFSASGPSPFLDVDPNYPQFREIAWMNYSGLSTGWKTAGSLREFRPKQATDRGAMAAFLYRFAADPNEYFVAGDIITDAVMFDSSTMTASEIQSFLEQRNPSCVAGEEACLKDYVSDNPEMDTEYCETYQAANGERASDVIYKTAVACGINPQVLLVTLQKEQGLVTASGSALTTIKYRQAMGYACPDGSACSAVYGEFARQIYFAASRLIEYGVHPEDFNYRAGETVEILFSPIRACGSSAVTIMNRATAALYNYTPYQPNGAALANVWEGDSCSTYGNRNFWRNFKAWFGPLH